VDVCLACHTTNKGIDHTGIDDVGELVVLLGEALDILLEGLIIFLHTMVEIP